MSHKNADLTLVNILNYQDLPIIFQGILFCGNRIADGGETIGGLGGAAGVQYAAAAEISLVRTGDCVELESL